MIPIQECSKNLDFSPEIPWPDQLPPYCFKNELICGFERLEGMAIVLDSPNLTQCLKAVYPELSFLELSRLSAKLNSEPSLQKEIWETYGYRYKETLEEVAQQTVKLPPEVQRWLHQKKFASQDLAPLRSLKDINLLMEFWPLLTNSHFSKSDGAKIIELLTELLLMEKPISALLPQKEISFWLKELHILRYPQTTQYDAQAEKKIRSVAWPLKSEAKWARRGDRGGIELKMFFSHPQELKRSLERLQQVCSDLQEQPEYEDLWSKN